MNTMSLVKSPKGQPAKLLTPTVKQEVLLGIYIDAMLLNIPQPTTRKAAELMGISQPAILSHLKLLEKKGFISRDPHRYGIVLHSQAIRLITKRSPKRLKNSSLARTEVMHERNLI
jgi:SOS-response transcriptional repressor LexA